MQSTKPLLGFLLTTLIAISCAESAFAQCSKGGSATGSSGTFMPSLSGSSYPIAANYSLSSPLVYQQSVYNQIAYQQQANYRLRAQSEARRQAAKDPTSEYNTNRAEKAFELAEKSEKAGKISAAKNYYNRVVKMVAGTDLASSAETAIQRLSEHDSTNLVASNSNPQR